MIGQGHISNLASIKEEKFTRVQGKLAPLVHLGNEDDEVSSENSDDFLKSLGFQDPFHKNLNETISKNENRHNPNSTPDLHHQRIDFPTS